MLSSQFTLISNTTVMPRRLVTVRLSSKRNATLYHQLKLTVSVLTLGHHPHRHTERVRVCGGVY